MSIKEWPEQERPREKLLSCGPQGLSDAELLAIFLRVGTKGYSALDLARNLIKHYGSLRDLLSASMADFCRFPGMGPAKYAQLQASLEMSKRFFRDQIKESSVLTNTSATQRFLIEALAHKKHEVFACLFLNNQHKVIVFEELFRGTIDSAAVYPREVIAAVIKHQAAAVIFCHNHPSGASDPSQSDIDITYRLKKALDLIDVRMLDHIIVAGNKTVSMAERGLI